MLLNRVMPRPRNETFICLRKRYFQALSFLYTGHWTVLTLTPKGHNVNRLDCIQRLEYALKSQKTIDYALFTPEIGENHGLYHFHGLVHTPTPSKFRKFKNHFNVLLGNNVSVTWISYMTKHIPNHFFEYTTNCFQTYAKINPTWKTWKSIFYYTDHNWKPEKKPDQPNDPEKYIIL